jgi:thioredoxin 1
VRRAALFHHQLAVSEVGLVAGGPVFEGLLGKEELHDVVHTSWQESAHISCLNGFFDALRRAQPGIKAATSHSHSKGTEMAKDTVTVLDSTFKTEVLESATPVLVDFWATWCAPCRAIAPALEELATQYKDKVKVAKVDVDENNGIAQQFGIRSIPTLLLFKGGKVVEQIVGAVPKSKLEESIKKAL